jgi:glycosyltransferase involved in cell wall biosynthesis
MKALHVIPAVGPRYGGPSQAVVELCRALQDVDVDAEICATDANGPARLPVELGKPVSYQGVRCHFFHRDCSEAFKFSRSLGIWLDENTSGFDLVHIHAVFSHATYAAARACCRAGVPYIVRPLGTLEPWSMRQKPIRKQIAWQSFFRGILKRATAVHYTTEQERELTEHSLDLQGGIVIPNGVDESLLEMHPSGRFRKAHGIPSEAPVMLTLSRLHPKKGIDVLLRVFVELKTHGQLPAWHLVIAGDGDPTYVTDLHNMIKGSTAESFIHWVGWLEGSAKLDALAEADLFVLSSHQENFGIGAVEAMACGTPSLLSRQVGLATDVARHCAGWVVDLNHDGLRSGLIEATADSKERGIRGENSRRLVVEQFTWTIISAQWRSLYAKIVQEHESKFTPEGAFQK